MLEEVKDTIKVIIAHHLSVTEVESKLALIFIVATNLLPNDQRDLKKKPSVSYRPKTAVCVSKLLKGEAF